MDWFYLSVAAVCLLFGFGAAYILATAEKRPSDERVAAYLAYTCLMALALIALCALRKLETTL